MFPVQEGEFAASCTAQWQLASASAASSLSGCSYAQPPPSAPVPPAGHAGDASIIYLKKKNKSWLEVNPTGGGARSQCCFLTDIFFLPGLLLW